MGWKDLFKFICKKDNSEEGKFGWARPLYVTLIKEHNLWQVVVKLEGKDKFLYPNNSKDYKSKGFDNLKLAKENGEQWAKIFNINFKNTFVKK